MSQMVRNRSFWGMHCVSFACEPHPATPHPATVTGLRLWPGLARVCALRRVTVVSLSFDLIADGPRINPAVSMRWSVFICAQAAGYAQVASPSDGTFDRIASILYGAFPPGAESNRSIA